jgi:uncharacterized membrane protein
MSKGASHRKNGRRPSVVYSAIVVVGLVLTVLGAIVAVVGVSNSDLFTASLGDARVKTSSVGLAIMVVGAAITVVAAISKPRDVQLFSPDLSHGPGDRLLDRVARVQLCVAAAGTVVLGASLLI